MNEDALSLFREGFNCSQSVLAAHATDLGMARDQALRLASGFGAGLGRKQEVCGAVSGGAMVLGLRYGHTAAADKEGKERIYALVRTLQERFAALHGTTLCRGLLGCDMLTPEGQKTMQERRLIVNVCEKCVSSADQLVQEILKENP